MVSGTWDMFGEELLEEAVMTGFDEYEYLKEQYGEREADRRLGRQSQVNGTFSTAELWQQAITSDDRSLLAKRLREAFEEAVSALSEPGAPFLEYDKMDGETADAVWGKVVEELDTYAHVHGKVQ